MRLKESEKAYCESIQRERIREREYSERVEKRKRIFRERERESGNEGEFIERERKGKCASTIEKVSIQREKETFVFIERKARE